ncbi:MAG TPA: ROK family protein [Tepidisphaeraceae bacterium]|nr:ROK family protein [Tepidisphaeraceae bacterium]
MTDSPSALGIDIGGTSVKVVALRGDALLWSARRRYRMPGRTELTLAVQSAINGREGRFNSVGLCVPGLLDEQKERVELSVNVPGLVGVPLAEMIAQAVGGAPARLRITNDSIASGYDIYASRKLTGRLLVLALGTGVGAAVLDEGVPLTVDNESPGHIGQFDVSVEGAPLIGPDGGAGSLEGYIGAEALRQNYGADPASKLQPDHPPIKALARAVRICHAIYRPHHVVLAGGLGIRLGHLLPELKLLIETHLTSIARPGWTLAAGDSDFHAARGAARMAEK